MKHSPWVSEAEAIKRLDVTWQTLRSWREIGYLKQGTHWRLNRNNHKSITHSKVIYHLNWCNEVMEYWRDQDAPISKKVA